MVTSADQRQGVFFISLVFEQVYEMPIEETLVLLFLFGVFAIYFEGGKNCLVTIRLYHYPLDPPFFHSCAATILVHTHIQLHQVSGQVVTVSTSSLDFFFPSTKMPP